MYKTENIDNDDAIRIFKTLKNLEGKEIDYSNLVYKSDDNVYFDFGKYGLLSSVYLKLIEGRISLKNAKNAKLSLREFNADINSLEKKKAKKQPYLKNKESVLKNARIMYKGMNLIVNAFKNNVFVYPYRFGARPGHELGDEKMNKMKKFLIQDDKVMTNNFSLQKKYQKIFLI